MKQLKFKKVIKDQLKNIKKWKKMDTSDFTMKKNYSFIEINNQKVKDEYNIKGNHLELEFIISKTFICYSSVSSIYDVDEKSLLKISKKNEYRIINISKGFNFIDEYIPIIEKLIDKDYIVIPLDNKILIKTDEIMINFGNISITTDEIND